MVTLLYDYIFGKKGETTTLRRAIRQCLLFQDLNPIEVKFLEEMVHIRHFQPGEAIFNQGEIGIGMYIILSGKISIFVETSTSDDGGKSPSSPIITLDEGAFFGEISLVEVHSRRTATASAETQVSLVGFFKPDLHEILKRTPTTGVKILLRLGEVIARRLKETTMKVNQLKNELR